MPSLMIISSVLFMIILGYCIVSCFIPINLWIEALLSGVNISLKDLVEMRLRQINPDIIVRSLITARKAGINLTVMQLEAHYLVKGNVPLVIEALVAAEKAGFGMDFHHACAIDLAGGDVLAEAVNPGSTPS